MYRFVDDSIEINDRWFAYLTKHISILQDFSFWNLVKAASNRVDKAPPATSAAVPPVIVRMKSRRLGPRP